MTNVIKIKLENKNGEKEALFSVKYIRRLNKPLASIIW